MPVVTDPYDDDDDHPTLQRQAPASSHVVMSPVTGLAIDPRLAFAPLGPLDPLAPLPPMLDDTTNDEPIANVPDYTDMETPKVPLDVAALLRLASQDIDEEDE
jgi:hypothetical protein